MTFNLGNVELYFFLAPCICHAESPKVKQLNHLCHSAYLFWDLYCHVWILRLLVSKMLLSLGTTSSAVWRSVWASRPAKHSFFRLDRILTCLLYVDWSLA